MNLSRIKLFRILIFAASLAACGGSLVAADPSGDEPTVLDQFNGPVADILPIYERMTGKILIRDANLAGPNLSIVVPQPIPKSEAIRLIEAVLQLNGYSLVPGEDNTVKVLNAASNKSPRSEAIPLYATISALPKGDQVVSYFMPLSYISPSDAAKVFTEHIKPHAYASFVQIPNAQALVVTENASVVRNLAGLKELIDVPPAKVASEFVKLERADAERVVEILNKLLESRKGGGGEGTTPAPPPPGPPTSRGAAATGFSAASAGLYEKNLVIGDVQLVADPRTNRILVVTRPVNLDYITGLIHEFDVATKLTEPLEIPLRYVTAAEVLPVLQAVLTETKDAAASTGTAARGAAPAAAPTTGTADRIAAPTADTGPESVVVGKTRLIADKKVNSILVLGPLESAEKVRTVLARLDKRPMQVYLSSVIGQLNLNDGSEFGVDLLQKFIRTGDHGVKSSGFSTGMRTRSGALDLVPDPKTLLTGAAIPLASGLTLYGAIGSTLDLYVKALETSNRFKVLARPVVYTTNNKKAVISSGQKVAVPTSTLSSLSTGATNNTAVSASIDFKDVVLKLEVLPLINSNKEVTLQIAEKNDSIVGSQTISGNVIPTIGTQEINTTITVGNNATVVLGGLITETASRATTGVPWISRIPLIGNLFKDTQKSTQRTELIILIQPTVIESDEDLLRAGKSETYRTVVGSEAEVMAEPPLISVPRPVDEPRRIKKE